MTDAQLLAATREAIDALTTGGAKSYAIGARNVTKLDLADLWKQVGLLEARIDAASTGGASVVRFREPL